MAGMLPGVECARRRRFHQSGGCSDSPSAACTRRSSFCLYTSNHESHHTNSSSSSVHRRTLNQAYSDDKLGGVAREAKERLDERLRTDRKSEATSGLRKKGKESLKTVDGRATAVGELQTEKFGTKSGSKRFSWRKLSWKASEQVECAVCLECFKPGDALMHLPCAHRFHSSCLVPWLETNSHCPCCRTWIFVSV